MDATILAAALKAAMIQHLGVDLTDPKVQEANVEQNTEDIAQAMAEVIVDHIQTYATVTFTPGTITGTCPSGGGPLINGTGSSGEIS